MASQLTHVLPCALAADIHWNTSQPVRKLLDVDDQPRVVLMYVSNIDYFVGPQGWLKSVRSWARELKGTSTKLNVLHCNTLHDSLRTTTINLGVREMPYAAMVTEGIVEMYKGSNWI